MSLDSKITEFPHSGNQSKSVTLDEAIQAINEWRANKETRGEQMPEHIWDIIFKLLNKYPESTVYTALGITKMQVQRKMSTKNPANFSTQSSDLSRLDFCEVKQTPAPVYKPERIPATNTLVVEFCRADGKIMKIHTTTDSFSELMKAFFAGG